LPRSNCAYLSILKLIKPGYRGLVELDQGLTSFAMSALNCGVNWARLSGTESGFVARQAAQWRPNTGAK